jgi:hypothetical protein
VAGFLSRGAGRGAGLWGETGARLGGVAEVGTATSTQNLPLSFQGRQALDEVTPEEDEEAGDRNGRDRAGSHRSPTISAC